MHSGRLLWIVLGLLAAAGLALVFNGDGKIVGLDDDQFASLAYYGAWGLVLASTAVLMLRTRLGEALRGAAIWFLAFVVLIGLYTFLPDLASLKNRLMAALVPGTLVAIGAPEGNRFMALRGRDDHFRLDGSIDGEPVSFIVDTGASVVAMDRAIAETIGIDTARLRFSHEVMTANGIARAAQIRLDSVRVGDIVRHDVPAAVTEGEGLGVALLGMSFLNTLTSFDFRGDRLILTD
ncbi:MAG TPA: TIGR02281 family clan AA aspartic protease [Aurantimonas sp.]|uniref:TIGR02281 family clan AA aspartic protease n=1 Tax=Aurantimonas marianensis TaxID=2920428 RepID=A0A9X2KDT7_9HYPH|nr:TIGR02281 family clan AA aspartic protease [Aurantimonas marianensis]MCP3054743.1 TIGR02281 family clan AA aspartic protease [Aurantimonas marianensis]